LRTGDGQFPLRMGQDFFEMPRHLYNVTQATLPATIPTDV